MHARDEVTQGTYEVQRAKLLREPSALKMSTAKGAVLTLVIILLLFIILRIVGFMLNNL